MILLQQKMEILKNRLEMTSPTITPNLKFKISVKIHMLSALLLKAMEIEWMVSLKTYALICAR
jgi:hypothetical protein